MSRFGSLARGVAGWLKPWPWPARPAARRVRVACWTYFGLVALCWLTIWGLGDVWAVVTLLLFGPRWVVAVPLVPLVPLAILIDRRSVVPLVGAGLVAAFPITGANLPVVGLFTSPPPGVRLRVLTCNTDGPHLNRAALNLLITKTMPDVILLQEFTADYAADVLGQRDWHTRVGAHGLFLASRFPVAEGDDLADGRLGGLGAVGRYRLTGFGEPGSASPTSLFVVNVHLATPRDGIEAVLRRHPGALGMLRQDLEIRRRESATAGGWVADLPGPTVIAGDFNMPADSAIFRTYWSDYQDGFAAAGFGWGATKQTGWFGLRIDHILSGPGWTCRRCWVGPDVGSDHLPMLADLDWSPPGPR